MKILKAAFTRVVTAAAVTASVMASALAAPEVTPLVSTSWLEENLGSDEIVILDTRSAISKSGRDDYLKGHIPGAVWSEYPGYWRTERNGVEGVLPSIDKLEAALSEIGVSEDKAVVIVPHGKSSLEFGSAARIYWTFKYLGHKAVTILDGGHEAWVAENRPLETGNVVPEGDMFIAEINQDLLISTDEVASALTSDVILLDGRPQNQFDGKEKHKASTRFGHIPGAVNLDQAQFYDKATNRLKSPDQISSLIPASLTSEDKPIISYCNTGHWAATNWFILSELQGRENVTLYDDSMVGWTRQADLPINGPDTQAAPATN